MPFNDDRFITVAIHTYDKAIALRSLLEREGIEVQFRNVNIEQPVISSGIRVRIKEADLPRALRIIENREIFTDPVGPARSSDPSNPVVVPVDFSDNSIMAVKVAFRIASHHKTSIVLLHTYIDPYVAGSMQLTDSLTYEIADANAREKIKATATTQMRHFSDRIKEMIKAGEIPPVKYDTCVTEGVPEDAINDYTKANNPFIIVMATRGSMRKQAEMIGSVTAEVLDKCRFTVLAIPEHPAISMKHPNRILFISNLEQEDILAIDTLYRLFPSAKAKVTIATVPGKKRSAFRSEGSKKALRDYCSNNFKNYSFEVTDISLEKVLDDFNQLESENMFDLIVIPNKKKNIFSRLFNPSLAHKILFAADAPMLVIPV